MPVVDAPAAGIEDADRAEVPLDGLVKAKHHPGRLLGHGDAARRGGALKLRVRRCHAWEGQAWASKVLTEMAEQRRELGLTTGPVPELSDPPEVVPVVAFGTPIERPDDAGRRFSAVRDAVTKAGVRLDELELWAVDSETAAVTRTDATTLDARFAQRTA